VASSLDLEADEDLLKINAVIVGTFGTIAMIRQYPGWQCSPEDAMVLSQPLYDILKKYPKVFEKVLDASAPLALVTAAAWLVGPRVMADKVYHDQVREMVRNQARNVTPPGPSTTQAGPQTVPPGPVPPGPEAPSQNGQGAPFPKDLSGIAGWTAEEVTLA
jgi:hypothetical protein